MVCQLAIITPTTEYKTIYHNVIKEEKNETLGSNCVAYAKSKRDIGTGLSTLEQKKSHITTNEPKEGMVGVTAEGPVGHLVVVEEIKEESVIVIEGNYHHGYITWREIPKQKIIGYF